MAQTGDNLHPPGNLADAADRMSWERIRHGRMEDHATPDDIVQVYRAPWTPAAETRYGGVDEEPS